MASIHRKKRSPYFQAYWRDEHGRPHCRSTKQRTRKEAQRVADLWELTAKHRRSASHMRSVFAQMYRELYGSDLPSVTFRAFAQKWLDEKRVEATPSSIRSYITTVHHFIDFLGGERADADLSLISRDDIVKWRGQLVSRLFHVTVNRHLTTLRSLFKCAKRDAFITENPLEGVSAVAAAKVDCDSARRPFTLSEIQTVLSHADPEWQSLIRFGFYSAQRLSDLASLRWTNIDLERDEIRFVAQKTRRRVLIPICAPLREHLLSLSAPDSPDAPLHPRAFASLQHSHSASALSQQFALLLVQAGLRTNDSLTHRSRGIGRSTRRRREELSFHSLRHSATSVLHESGVAPSAVKALVGHDSNAVHQSYIDIGMPTLREAASRLPVL
jgi:integrase